MGLPDGHQSSCKGGGGMMYCVSRQVVSHQFGTGWDRPAPTEEMIQVGAIRTAGIVGKRGFEIRTDFRRNGEMCGTA